jgi:tetratricopeptide (TPR) repeat protein
MRERVIFIVVIATSVVLASYSRGAEPPPRRQTLRLLAQGPRPGSMLMREVARQAVLIAGRDQLGLSTRDQSLCEPITGVPGDDAIAPLDVHVSFRPSDSVQFELIESPGAGGASRSLWRTTFELGKDASNSPVTAFATAIEPHIQTDLAGALRDAGFTDSGADAISPAHRSERDLAPESAQTTPSGPDLNHQIRTLTMFGQFQVLRAAHVRVRAESPASESIGLLVRAYANLGQLTAFQWHASSKVFFARALLYAEKMVQDHPKDPIALWHRAYARTLSGLHAAALSDLKTADELAKQSHIEAPKWVALLSPACRFDVPALFRLAQSDPDLAPLGMYLSFLDVENSGSVATIINMAKAALVVSPQCMRLLDGMCAVAGVSYMHDLTVRFPEMFKLSLAQNLPEIAGLPPTVKAVLAGAQWNVPKTRAELVTTLVAAANDPQNPDSGEPSWAVLGTMIRDTYTVHVQRRINFLDNQWAVGNDETRAFGRAAMELVGSAPDAPILRSYGCRYPAADCLARLKGYAPQDLGIGFAPVVQDHLIGGNDAVDKQYANPLFEQMRQHNFDTAGDLEVFAAWYWQDSFNSPVALKYLRRIIGRLKQVSPYDPRVIAFQIRHEWKKSAEQAREWETAYGGHPLVTGQLAIQYWHLKRNQDAERMLELYVKACPDRWGYEALGQVQLELGDEAKSLQTLQYYLDHVEDYGLGHARVQNDIAEHFMHKREYEKALPYADAAAESGASWAMITASHAHERLGQWKQAESLIREDAQRYQGDAHEWYIFCRRTGHGDVAAARVLAADYLHHSHEQTVGAYTERGMLQMLNGDDRQALQEFSACLKKNDDLWSGLQAALLCDRLGDDAGRNATLQNCDEIAKKLIKKDPKARLWEGVQLTALLKDHFDQMPDKPLDFGAIEKLMRGASAPAQTAVAFVAGTFLDDHGQKPQATKLFKKCVELNDGWRYQQVPAWIALRERGIDPLAIKPAPPTTQRSLKYH